MLKHVVIYIFSVLISSVSQIMLKSSTYKHYDRVWEEYLNVKVMTAYAIFFCSSLLTIYAYKKVPLSMGPVLESTGYIFVTILGYVCLHEKVGIRKLLGVLCIFAGVIIFYI